MAVGATGADLKKGTWRAAGRPLVCSVHGSTGSDTAYTLACEVLDRDDFNRRHRSLLRAHDGAGGDPRRATRFLDRPPTDDETNATLRVLCQLDVRCAQPAAAGQHARTVKVSPHLLRRADGAVPDYTAHSLKQWKIDLYHALLLHTDFIVEPGAHAGSQLERMSVAGATNQARQIRPTGLSVALRYARASRSQSVLEVESLVWAAVRAWVAEAGLAHLPREYGWAAITRWSSSRAADDAANAKPLSLLSMRPSHIEAEPTDDGVESDDE
jgi:hypothetical protein